MGFNLGFKGLTIADFLRLFPATGRIGEHVTYRFFPRCGKSALVQLLATCLCSTDGL